MCFTLRSLWLVCLLTTVHTLTGQIELGVVVVDGTVSTTCDDLFSGPDPQYRVVIEGQGTVYPMDGNCYVDPPFLQYMQPYMCAGELPLTVGVCLEVFENDGLFGCNIQESCLVTICQDFVVPAIGDTISYVLSTPTGGASEGSVQLLIGVAGPVQGDNDLPCNAYSLGTIAYGDTLGNGSSSLFNNFCGTNANEPQPLDFGSWQNTNAVWFTFNSGANPSGLFAFEAFSNPDGLGDDIDLEMAVFTANGDPCNGGLTLVRSLFDNQTDDIAFRLHCPEPNTDYYIMIDGSAFTDPAGLLGTFGLQVWDIGVPEGGDRRCDFVDLGEVPEGGSVATDGYYANFCADAIQDPFVSGFVSQHSVFFSFIAPPSGHVIIEGISQSQIDGIGLQLALYRSFSNQCNGFFTQVASQYTLDDEDEIMEVSCLYGGRPYFLLIDGDGNNAKGVFSITVTDAGDITPVTEQDIVLCAGETLPIGNANYDTTGLYVDTLRVFAGCDSIVISNLTILEEIEVTIEQLTPAIGLGGNEATARVSAIGGTGNYSYDWCNGQTGSMADQLIGGDQCCVQVTDDLGCTATACLDIIFTTDIVPFFRNDTLACAGDTNGTIAFGPMRGIPPYTYVWTNTAGNLNGMGNIMAEGQEVTIPSLPADTYQVTLADDYGDTTFTVLVAEPLPLLIEPDMASDASCFGFCDAMITPAVSGGTPPYTYAWSTGVTTLMVDGLCVGTYGLTVTDANNCVATYSESVGEPAEFIASVTVTQAISCMGGDDGSLRVETNGSPVQYAWDNGASGVQLDNLITGSYTVTVTNADGCEATATYLLAEPTQPLLASIAVLEPVSCAGAADGILVVEVSGPYETLTYSWSSGQTNVLAGGLLAGEYRVEVRNEKGCMTTATYILADPPLLTAALAVRDITCRPGESTGVITVENTQGGRPGYTYALGVDGAFGAAAEFLGLSAGSYEVVVRDATGCTLSLSAQVLPAPELVVDLGLEPETVLHLGDSLLLYAAVNSDDAVFDWSHSDSVFTDELWVRPISTTTYQVVATDTVTACRASAALRVVVEGDRRIFIPNVFSPNDDGTNDIFYVFGGNEVVRIESLRIFARTGALVYEQTDMAINDPRLGWTGKSRGQMLPQGVYVYQAIIDFIDGKREVFAGDVTLMR